MPNRAATVLFSLFQINKKLVRDMGINGNGINVSLLASSELTPS
ncbi:hypothetical protein P4646_20155 [Peribacillus simplex]|nr:hypothetical protein [Peribacillus simplex]MED3986345.1 hypothetical protein [Peribacillus simplex]MED4092821.1 hypothetical protein [Peribacillus simplex]CAH0304170.1 hypothetical protein SRABI84_04615 [Peribacillus simplex]